MSCIAMSDYLRIRICRIPRVVVLSHKGVRRIGNLRFLTVQELVAITAKCLGTVLE
jgi:hypothetical protein